MFKFNWLLSTGFATAMLAVGLSANPAQFARAQGNSSTTMTSIFGEFFNKQDNDPGGGETGGGGTRGEFCPITPLNREETVAEIWSDRPLFVWRSLQIIDRIAVRVPDSEEMLWEQQVRARGAQMVSYDGEALQPGQTYEWVLTSPQDPNEPMTIPFKVMEESERDRISQELSQLEQDWQERGASAEEIAWQRATYFAQQRLWSDALREIYSVETPSPELGEAMQDIANLICTSP